MNVSAGIGRIKSELMKFGLVGAIAYVIDVSTFNILRFHGGEGILFEKPLTAKVISTAIATTWAYFGNRHWAFRHRQRTSFRREYLLFLLLNGFGMIIALSCLWISHYGMHLTSPIADNISANIFGLVFGTAFRFWSYRKWVFLDSAPDLAEEISVLAP